MRFAISPIATGKYDVWPVSEEATTPTIALSELLNRYPDLDQDFEVSTVIEIALPPDQEVIYKKLEELLEAVGHISVGENVGGLLNLLIARSFEAGCKCFFRP